MTTPNTRPARTDVDTCPLCGWVVDYSCGCPEGPTFPLIPAQGIEARRAETGEDTGSVHESPVRDSECAPTPPEAA